LDSIPQVTPRENGPSGLCGSLGLLILVKFQRTIPILVLVVFDAMRLESHQLGGSRDWFVLRSLPEAVGIHIESVWVRVRMTGLVSNLAT
jgi:hypothetical protein